jgi:hypothetical protein
MKEYSSEFVAKKEWIRFNQLIFYQNLGSHHFSTGTLPPMMKFKEGRFQVIPLDEGVVWADAVQLEKGLKPTAFER